MAVTLLLNNILRNGCHIRLCASKEDVTGVSLAVYITSFSLCKSIMQIINLWCSSCVWNFSTKICINFFIYIQLYFHTFFINVYFNGCLAFHTFILTNVISLLAIVSPATPSDLLSQISLFRSNTIPFISPSSLLRNMWTNFGWTQM